MPHDQCIVNIAFNQSFHELVLLASQANFFIPMIDCYLTLVSLYYYIYIPKQHKSP